MTAENESLPLMRKTFIEALREEGAIRRVKTGVSSAYAEDFH